MSRSSSRVAAQSAAPASPLSAAMKQAVTDGDADAVRALLDSEHADAKDLLPYAARRPLRNGGNAVARGLRELLAGLLVRFARRGCAVRLAGARLSTG